VIERFCVRFRFGGRESVPRRAGTFRTQREAKIRRDWVAGELAAMRQAVAKTRRARWVPVNAEVFEAVVGTVPREDRDLAAAVFSGFGIDRFRTAISRACKAAGVPVFSPHDLRHRRATLWHLQGVPIADAAAWLGHSPSEHLATYAHATLVDRDELAYPALLGLCTNSNAATAAEGAR
jgi:integrase